MKFLTFSHGDSQPKLGLLIDNGQSVLDLQAVYFDRWDKHEPTLTSVMAVVEGGANALDLVSDVLAHSTHTRGVEKIAVSQVKFSAPIPCPPQMRDFLCFEKHLIQAFQAARRLRASQAPDPFAAIQEMEAKGILCVPQTWYERPLFYHPNRLNVIGTNEDVIWPSYSNVMDFELEFGAIIGKKGKNITANNARECIFGYTIFNDFSARDEQVLEMPGQLGPGKGKDFDGSNAMGPCLVTADEIPNPYNLSMIIRVNGEVWGRGQTSEMHWRFEDCIAHVSRDETIYPGEFFGSGTVGNGCGLEQMRFLNNGDIVELEVENIGILRNRVIKPSF